MKATFTPQRERALRKKHQLRCAISRLAAECSLNSGKGRRKCLFCHSPDTKGQYDSNRSNAHKLEGTAPQPGIVGLLTREPAALDDGSIERYQLKSAGLADGHDFLDRKPVIRRKPGPRAVAPDNARDDHMISAAQLDLGSLRTGAAGLDHEPARGNIEDARIAPPGAAPKAGGKDDAPAKLTGALTRVHP